VSGELNDQLTGARPTRPLDIETIRVPAERVAAAQLLRLEPFSRDGFRTRVSAHHRRQLLGSALLLTSTMAPSAYAAAREAMATLRVDDQIELYQSASREVDATRLAVWGNPIGIELIGNHLDHLDHAGLVALFGHEIGHSIAHCQNNEFAWALSVSQQPNTPTRRLYSIAAELTADRLGLIACGDLDAVLRLEMLLSVGHTTKGITFDTQAYLAQCRSLAEETLSSGQRLLGTSHPEHYIRSYAEALFSETDVYCEIVGKGSPTRSLGDVNAILSKLLRIEVVSPSTTKPATTDENPDAKEKEKEKAKEKEKEIEKPRSTIRENVKNAGSAIGRFAGGVLPSIKAYTDAALGEKEKKKTDEPVEEFEDPLEEDDRDMAARFEALENEANPKVRIGD
jgi:hypothetical protein